MTTTPEHDDEGTVQVPLEAKISVLARQRDEALNAAANWEAAALGLRQEVLDLRQVVQSLQQEANREDATP